jgi:hypothetical protein
VIRAGAASRLWAITTCFNPVEDRRRVDNYRRFRAALDVPLATVEIAFDGRWDLSEQDADLYIRVRDADVLWQKEKLLNLLLRKLPEECTHVAWLDSDVLMMEPDWSHRAVDALVVDPVVQLFSRLRYLGSDGSQHGNASTSVAAAIRDGVAPAAALAGVVERTKNALSPGMAWAARREVLDRHGFYDACIIGGGDTALACAAWGVPGIAMQLHHMNEGQCARYADWAARFHRDTGGRVGVLEGEIHHLWHGDLASRLAGQRHIELARHSFDPGGDIAPGADGAWRWASDKSELHALLRNYFMGRAGSF